MSDTGPAKRAMRQTADGKRSRGRPKCKYMDQIPEDIRELRVRNWRGAGRHNTACGANDEDDDDNQYSSPKFYLHRLNRFKVTKEITLVTSHLKLYI